MERPPDEIEVTRGMRRAGGKALRKVGSRATFEERAELAYRAMRALEPDPWGNINLARGFSPKEIAEIRAEHEEHNG